MAAPDAIKYVGSTLVTLLKAGLTGSVPAANVRLSTPDEVKTSTPPPPSVTAFLYHVSINGEMRNTPRTGSPLNGARRPALPLDLRFLITPWTAKPEEAYAILGMIARLLYDRARLVFQDLDGGAVVWDPADTVEIMMESLPVEEHYDVWEPTGLPYRTSLAYLVRVIGIDAGPPKPSPIVSNLNLTKATSAP